MGKSLVTLAEYKAYANIASPNQDAAINSIIPKVSDLVKSLCKRTFVDYVDEDKTEYFTGGSRLYLKEYPILSITGIEKSIDYGSTYTELVKFTDYVLDLEDDSIVSLHPCGFLRSINGYKVVYKAGYEVLPEDLKLAVFDLITYYLKNDTAVHSPKAPGTNSVQIEYITSVALPAHIKRVLDLYVGSFD